MTWILPTEHGNSEERSDSGYNLKMELTTPADRFNFRGEWNRIIKNDTYAFSLSNWMNIGAIRQIGKTCGGAELERRSIKLI